MITRKGHNVQHNRMRKEKIRKIFDLHQCKVNFAMVLGILFQASYKLSEKQLHNTQIFFSSLVYINMAWFQISLPFSNTLLSSARSSQHNQIALIFLQKKNIMHEKK